MKFLLRAALVLGALVCVAGGVLADGTKEAPHMAFRQLAFRKFNATAFPSYPFFVDTLKVSYPAGSMVSVGSFIDTTVSLSLDGLASYPATDSVRATFTANYDTAPAASDSLTITTQVSYDGVNWFSIGANSLVPNSQVVRLVLASANVSGLPIAGASWNSWASAKALRWILRVDSAPGSASTIRAHVAWPSVREDD